MHQAIALLVSALILSTGCERPPEDLPTRIDGAVSDAERYLRSKQDDDGAWRSETYGTLTDGITLTPPLLKTLVMLEGEGAYDDAACRHGATYLRSWVGQDGAIPQDIVFDFPVYSAALSAITLSRLPGAPNARARDAWLELLRRHQLTEQLGWMPDDLAYGGWGYSVFPPQRPDEAVGATLPFESDLSSTLFAVGALRLAGVSPDDPTIVKALRFVERCQNFGESEYDDGGFFLSPTIPVQNKAGEAGVDADGRTRFHSYGSATADGLRALLQCGLGPNDPRVVTARQWIERNFTVETNPGAFEPAREQDRDAAYFYWCWSVTHSLRRMGVRELEGDGVDIAWPELLARALLERQQPDGSWRNRFSFVKEDDPLIATAFAAAALANCREMMLE